MQINQLLEVIELKANSSSSVFSKLWNYLSLPVFEKKNRITKNSILSGLDL
jgi:hypothetical protein